MNIVVETQLEFDFMKPEQPTFEFSKDPSFYFLTTSSSELLTLKPNYSVSFHREEKMIGKLDWNDGPMTFEGDADESAQIFFDNVFKQHIQTQLPFSGWKS